MVLNGFPRHRIITFGKSQWNACDRTTDGYISDVADMMRNKNLENHEYNLNLMNSRIEDLINKCYTENDKKTMVQLLKLQSDILGLNKQKLDITSNGKDISVSEIVVKIVRSNDEEEEDLS
jgi:hypothetical protein